MKRLEESTLVIVGLGLMGGSFALALRRCRARPVIIGIDRDAGTCAEAVARGVVDLSGTDLAAVSRAEAVILATPVRSILQLLPQVGALVSPGTLLMDLGSTKREVAEAMVRLPGHVEPIGGHPMCGKETAGLSAAVADLFQDSAFALCKLARTHPETVAQAESLVRALGARPIFVDPERHDRIVAATSHLPFALATTLMTTIIPIAASDELVGALSAGGLRDTSRVAASETSMMLDVLLTNSDLVADLLSSYSARLAELADLIRQRDESALRILLQAAAEKRRELFPK